MATSACYHSGEDYVLLDNVQGYGYYVGTYLALTALERYWWGEGEFKFYVDGDSTYPTQHSTGSEDYFGGAGLSIRETILATHQHNVFRRYMLVILGSRNGIIPVISSRLGMLTRYMVSVMMHCLCMGCTAGTYPTL